MAKLVKLTQEEYGLLLSKSLILHELISSNVATPELLKLITDKLSKGATPE